MSKRETPGEAWPERALGQAKAWQRGEACAAWRELLPLRGEECGGREPEIRSDWRPLARVWLRKLGVCGCVAAQAGEPRAGAGAESPREETAGVPVSGKRWRGLRLCSGCDRAMRQEHSGRHLAIRKMTGKQGAGHSTAASQPEHRQSEPAGKEGGSHDVWRIFCSRRVKKQALPLMQEAAPGISLLPKSCK